MVLFFISMLFLLTKNILLNDDNNFFQVNYSKRVQFQIHIRCVFKTSHWDCCVLEKSVISL